ncbi:GNAT family N-acetyltransferase [Paludibacterium sp. B53371]|uniref:GNAT family N-acetyltransferase n=1 Tax=Paludibacterium sp. B53371 TaxID=2806263 RepID=UPI001C03D6C7|nr:GNAT family N-acetyltransferase [Paludibacterium sp. B53371]
MPTLQLRTVRPADAADLAALYASDGVLAGTLQLPHGSVEGWHRRLQAIPPAIHILVAEQAGQVIGQVIGQVVLEVQAAPRQHTGMLVLAVAPAWQGQGIGRRLLQAAIELADETLGLRRLELAVNDDNLPALALYQQCGFQCEATCPGFAFSQGRYVQALRMARRRPATP